MGESQIVAVTPDPAIEHALSVSAGFTLELRGIEKQYGATRALDGADLAVAPSSIHALLGGNGSGKSTLIKVLAGIVRADSGTIAISGRSHNASDHRPFHADDGGVRFVHQQGATFPGMSVTENVLTATNSLPRTRWGAVDWRTAHRQAKQILDHYSIDADPRAPLGTLRPVTQQMIAIARALNSNPEGPPVTALVLDEPTATLPPAEVELLHDAVRRYAALGCSIVYVTHRLEELYGFVDHATILRDGRVVGRLETADITHDRLVDLLTGGTLKEAAPARRVEAAAAAETKRTGTPRLRVNDLYGGPVKGIDLELHPGEIVGVAGLVGSGRSTLLQMLFGLNSSTSGTVELDGQPLRYRRGRVFTDVAYVPEDRLADAAFTAMSLTENVLAAQPGRHWRHGRLNKRRERTEAQSLMKEYRIKAETPASTLGSLSGGNQQKAIIARWLSCNPKLVLLDEPSQGVDIGARAEIHDLVRRAAAAGASVLVISSDLEELALLCHSAVVLVNGRIGFSIPQDQLTAERLERLSYGEHPAGATA